MKVLLATPGRFHIMALARELQQRQVLARVVSGFPAFALKRERIDRRLLVTAPFYQTLHFGLGRLKVPAPYDEFKFRSTKAVDRAACAVLKEARVLPDVYMALSQTGTASGALARELGVTYVCDRGSTHIEEQREILNEEYRVQGVPPPRIDPRSIERELIEYQTSQLITVPSQFVARSFVKRGIDPGKLRVVPYGANISMFRPTVPKSPDAVDFLFVGALSIRKGLPYLLQAFGRVRHPQKRLTLIGSSVQETEQILRKYPTADIRIMGAIPQARLADYMSAARLLVLPSVEDGFGLVMAEAMACGCPVLASMNTGAENLFEDGQQGFIVEARDVAALAERMQRLADEPALALEMGRTARARIDHIGGWSDYADAILGAFAAARPGPS